MHLRFRLSDHKQHTLDRLEKEVIKLKEDTNAKSEELDIRQRCLNEFQMMALDSTKSVYILQYPFNESEKEF